MKVLSISEVKQKKLRGDISIVANDLNISVPCTLMSLNRPTSKRHHEVLGKLSDIIYNRDSDRVNSIEQMAKELREATSQVEQFCKWLKANPDFAPNRFLYWSANLQTDLQKPLQMMVEVARNLDGGRHFVTGAGIDIKAVGAAIRSMKEPRVK